MNEEQTIATLQRHVAHLTEAMDKVLELTEQRLQSEGPKGWEVQALANMALRAARATTRDMPPLPPEAPRTLVHNGWAVTITSTFGNGAVAVLRADKPGLVTLTDNGVALMAQVTTEESKSLFTGCVAEWSKLK